MSDPIELHDGDSINGEVYVQAETPANIMDLADGKFNRVSSADNLYSPFLIYGDRNNPADQTFENKYFLNNNTGVTARGPEPYQPFSLILKRTRVLFRATYTNTNAAPGGFLRTSLVYRQWFYMDVGTDGEFEIPLDRIKPLKHHPRSWYNNVLYGIATFVDDIEFRYEGGAKFTMVEGTPTAINYGNWYCNVSTATNTDYSGSTVPKGFNTSNKPMPPAIDFAPLFGGGQQWINMTDRYAELPGPKGEWSPGKPYIWNVTNGCNILLKLEEIQYAAPPDGRYVDYLGEDQSELGFPPGDFLHPNLNVNKYVYDNPLPPPNVSDDGTISSTSESF